ncbi:hypothetical protein GGR57DRAFT_501192 [Xylariaceae sp. FL1272]|nr:hypothetical protein GGR57DRAFT_501192 [Xylariaceae sp. FL1272]
MQDKIKLQVGERQFITTKYTLVGESTYFAAMLSGRWNDADKDGVYFIDSDPDLFVEVLRYLRSGNYPLFFDTASQTYDYAKYTSLLGEAQYFGVKKLETWIKDQKYANAVTVRYYMKDVDIWKKGNGLTPREDEIRTRSLTTYPADTKLRISSNNKCTGHYGPSGGPGGHTRHCNVLFTQYVHDPKVCLGVTANVASRSR